MLSFLPQYDLIVLLYLSLYCREFLVVGLSSVILAGLICSLNKIKPQEFTTSTPPNLL